MINSDKINIIRYKITIEYIGTHFSGWQKQNNAISVQEAIENAIFLFTGQKIVVFAAGRTDSGVHALGQVAHFDLQQRRGDKFYNYEPREIIRAVNHFLRPLAINIIDCSIVSYEFHARFSAISRAYLYKILNQSCKNIFLENRVWWIRKNLNIEAMKEGSKYLIGMHDFTSFRAQNCQAKSPIKTINEIKITSQDNIINFYISAPSFLYHMVRNIVGSLVLIGEGKYPPSHIDFILKAKDRGKAGQTAPACGLFFLNVKFS